MKAFGRYGSLGFELLASIGIGYYGGVWLDKKFGTHWIAFVGFLLGCYAGFRSLFIAAKRMQRDIERDEALERGEDPWAPPAFEPDDSSVESRASRESLESREKRTSNEGNEETRDADGKSSRRT